MLSLLPRFKISNNFFGCFCIPYTNFSAKVLVYIFNNFNSYNFVDYTYVYPIYLQMINYDARVFKFSKLFFWFTVAPPVRGSISQQLIIVFNNNNISKHFVFATNIKDHKKRESWPSYELMSISSECQPCFLSLSSLSSLLSPLVFGWHCKIRSKLWNVAKI